MLSRSNHMRRRDFLRVSAFASALAAPFPVPAWAESRSPNEKLNVAVIGADGRRGRATHVVCDENLVGLCDVDERRLAQAATKFPKAKKYIDFRKMLTEMDGQIDAVVVCTPDHVHMPASVMAMKMGKHCFCQKPLGQNVHEVRVGTEVARKNKLATQIGTQTHAGDSYRRTVELIRAGTIGPVREVHVWSHLVRRWKAAAAAGREEPAEVSFRHTLRGRRRDVGDRLPESRKGSRIVSEAEIR